MFDGWSWQELADKYGFEHLEIPYRKCIGVNAVALKRFFGIFRCISEDICTDEVIITDNQVKHIKERHPSVYETFNLCLEEMINFPDYKNSIITFMKIDEKEWNSLRWKISYPSTRRWLDRGNPRDAGEWYACQTVLIKTERRYVRTCRLVLFCGDMDSHKYRNKLIGEFKLWINKPH